MTTRPLVSAPLFPATRFPALTNSLLLIAAIPSGCLDEQAHYSDSRNPPASNPTSGPTSRPAADSASDPAPDSGHDRGAEPQTSSGGDPKAGADHTPFTQILARRVRDELVDYDGLRQHDREDLRAYLAAMAEVEVDALGRDDRLAHYINLYNAAMLWAAVQRLDKDRDWRPDADEFAVFKDEFIQTREGVISLDTLEHQIIRKRFEEPRIHVALVCGARSCPPLLPSAYTGKTLDATLEANMQRFVNDDFRNPIDHDGQVLRLSRIFDWFKEDFGGDAGIVPYVNRYTERDVSDYEVEFVEYDWALNGVE